MMDRSEELPELVNGLSLHPSEAENGLSGDIDLLLKNISGLFSSIYGEYTECLRSRDWSVEIEELRHAGPKGDEATASIDKLVARLDATLESVQGRVESLLTSKPNGSGTGKEYEEDIAELKEQWEKVLRARGLLKEELKEDGWLIRFRT
jgi:chromosome segregation ATPase